MVRLIRLKVPDGFSGYELVRKDGAASDLLWDDVKVFFDVDLMGALPDLRVSHASVGDWQVVLDLVGTSGWRAQYTEGEVVMPIPRAQTMHWRPADAEIPTLRV